MLTSLRQTNKERTVQLGLRLAIPGGQSRHLRVFLTLLVFLLSLSFNLYNLGEESLHGDEGIYADIALRILATDIWYPLQSITGPYTAKPPLIAWPIAISFELLGPSELSARLPNATAGALTCALLFSFLTHHTKIWVGLLAAFLLSTAVPWLTPHGARHAVADNLVCLFVMTTLFMYYRYLTTGRPSWMIVALASAAMSSLFKGLFAPVILLAILILWEFIWASSAIEEKHSQEDLVRHNSIDQLSFRNWALMSFGQTNLWRPLVVFTASMVPYMVWLFDNLARNPDFLEKVYKQNIVRATHGLDPSHLNGPLFYPAILFECFGYWLFALLLLLPIWGSSSWSESKVEFLKSITAWAIVGIGLITLSASKLSWYAFPAFPAIAILIALGVERAFALLGRHVAFALPLTILIIVALGFRLASVQSLLTLPVEKSVLHGASIALSSIDGSRLYEDAGVRNGLRPWQVYYLSLMPAVTNTSEAESYTGCNFLLTEKTDIASKYSSVDASRTKLVARSDQMNSDLVLIDRCDGKLTEIMAAPSRTYAADLESGIDFERRGYPDFIRSVDGMSHFEPDGRWTNDKKVSFGFRQFLPLEFTLVIEANAFGPNAGLPLEVRIGEYSELLPLLGGWNSYRVHVKLSKPVDAIHFVVPSPTSPSSLGLSDDDRMLGLFLRRITFETDASLSVQAP